VCFVFVCRFFYCSILLFVVDFSNLFFFQIVSKKSFIFFCVYVFVCVYFFSQILHNHRGGMFLNFFLKYSLRPIFLFASFFEKKRCRTTTPHQFFVFFIMTMKTSSIILCFFNDRTSYIKLCLFSKKRFFVMFFGRWRGQDVFVRGGKFCFGKTFFGRDFCFFCISS